MWEGNIIRRCSLKYLQRRLEIRIELLHINREERRCFHEHRNNLNIINQRIEICLFPHIIREILHEILHGLIVEKCQTLLERGGELRDHACKLGLSEFIRIADVHEHSVVEEREELKLISARGSRDVREYLRVNRFGLRVHTEHSIDGGLAHDASNLDKEAVQGYVVRSVSEREEVRED